MENTFVCVLGPWPWPREGLPLALASKFFCVLGLGLELWSSNLPLIAVEGGLLKAHSHRRQGGWVGSRVMTTEKKISLL